jgi:DNA polymerase (family X)
VDRRREIIEMFRELAELTTLEEGSPQSFRVRAYENAMRAVEAMSGDLAAMTVAQLCKIEGIGKSSAQKIREQLDSGHVEKLETLRVKYPPAFVELARVPGIGPKRVAKLREALGVQSVADLRAALADQRVRHLEGFGEKSETNIAHALERLGLGGEEKRTPIEDAMPVAAALCAELTAMPEVVAARHCGSLRRMRETVADVDIVVAAEDARPIMARLPQLAVCHEVLAGGETKTSFLTRTGLQIDVRVVKPEQLGAATMYFTGSKAHNIKLRQRAIERGLLLNEYGLIDNATGNVVASRTEEEIYRALDLPWIPEVLREDAGEVEAALAGELPAAVGVEDMLGDLHVHTSLSGDGRSPLEAMLDSARARGYRYVAITDHAENLAINGVSREKLLEQRATLAALQERHPEMRLLHGCELNIAPDGSLDYDQDFRMTFDWCVAAVHSHFDLSPAQQTKRLLAAIANPAVSVIGHLSGRRIGTRPGIEFDIDEVLHAAAEHGTAIEINSALARLDASAEVLRRARAMVAEGKNLSFVISTDAHHTSELDRMQWGTKYALRGWVDKRRVANTWDAAKFAKWVAR